MFTKSDVVNAHLEILRCEQVLREGRGAILMARIRQALLWLPAVLGLSWAMHRTLAQHDVIAEWRYTLEEFTQNLRKLRLYGSTLALICGRDNGDSGYDGWLQPGDRYKGDDDNG